MAWLHTWAEFGLSNAEREKHGAVVALLSHRNVEEAANAVGVNERTMYRWMKDPDFQKAYREAKRAAFSQSIARLHQMWSAAVSTLAKIMVDANSPASTRVRAAESILNHSTKALEIEDIEARLTALEESGSKTGKR